MTAELIVQPSEIPAALSQIWEKMEGMGKMRACLFNLILYVEHTSRLDYIRKIAQSVIEKFPSRVIFVLCNGGSSEQGLQAKVSVLHSQAPESHSIACDLIEFHVTPNERKRIPFVILPNIISDLPVYLLWAEDPVASDPIFTQLSQVATRLIFDSESARSLPDFAREILTQLTKNEIEIADLNWGRAENWRDVLTSVFYSPERLQQLNAAKEIRISYNKISTASFCHTQIQAIYLQLWLASRLNWTVGNARKENEILTFTYTNESGPVLVTLKPQEIHDLAPGMVTSIEIFTKDEAHFLFSRETNPFQQVTVNISTHELCELPMHFLYPKGAKGQSLVKEICHRGSSEHFLKVLKLLSKMDSSNLC
jgi:glucose-6-phosphate dehydrogenase assembly protein OpcA